MRNFFIIFVFIVVLNGDLIPMRISAKNLLQTKRDLGCLSTGIIGTFTFDEMSNCNLAINCAVTRDNIDIDVCCENEIMRIYDNTGINLEINFEICDQQIKPIDFDGNVYRLKKIQVNITKFETLESMTGNIICDDANVNWTHSNSDSYVINSNKVPTTSCANCDEVQYCDCTKNTLLPFDIANLTLWLDASDNHTIFTDVGCINPAFDGNHIGCWMDKSNNSLNPWQLDSNRMPIYNATGFNNLPTIIFDGLNDALNTHRFRIFNTPNSPLTIFIVFETNNLNSSCFINQGYGNTCVNPLEICHSRIEKGELSIQKGCEQQTSTNASSIFPNLKYVVSIEILSFNSSPNNIKFHVNGHLVSSQMEGTGWINPGQYPILENVINIGYRVSGGGSGIGDNAFDGMISEIIIYQNTVTHSERIQIESYLSQKWLTNI